MRWTFMVTLFLAVSMSLAAPALADAHPRGQRHGYGPKHHVYRSYRAYPSYPRRIVHRHHSSCGHTLVRPYYETNVYYYDDPSWSLGFDSDGSVDVHVGW